MSKADDMFKELGYEIDIGDIYGLIRYNKNDNSYIRFMLEDKCIEANTIINNEIFVLSVDMELLKAINEKVKELGWKKDRKDYFHKYYLEKLKPKRKVME